MSKVSYTAEEAAAHITRDQYSWGFTTGTPIEVSYAFRLGRPSYDNGSDIYATFGQFNAKQVAATTVALDLWSDVANISFVPQSDVAGGDPFADSATMLFANYEARDGAGGFAYLPAASRTEGHYAQGDIWINRYYGLTSPEKGDYSNFTLIHEIGHAIGLQHPGHYDVLDGQPITYSNSAEYLEDSRQYTVMSYFNAGFTGAEHDWNFARTPLMHDITAIQMLYGANYQTRAGDTVYGFNSNAGAAFSFGSASERGVFSIWDGGGEDTLDFSRYEANQVINLRQESFSSVGGLTDNVSIASGVTIENAIGGRGRDRIIGNDAENEISGRGSADYISGGAGDDILKGNRGRDILIGSDGNDALYGGHGYDRLSGGAGDDLLVGGRHRDILRGGEGADRFTFNTLSDSGIGARRDIITDFAAGEDLIDLAAIDALASAAGDQAFQWIGTARYSGQGGELRYREVADGVVVKADFDGDSGDDFQIFVRNVRSLQASDFDL
ncbi:Serralysin A precursor [Methyloligella halotolerans]|uniref:Serralysin A n=1 Tax=Methyloligella halotolerans TaxID=1177755 RepID=A0A1E2S2L1_9HYPH|nr:M10 family metallopeptidase C-terminal domain-containing protein [Methyloligella halotolerans]ODA68652.1 Serralysin A precursor [Methyloligella halotolerans]